MPQYQNGYLGTASCGAGDMAVIEECCALHDDGSGADRAPGGRVALHGLWPGKRLAPSTALANPSRVRGDALSETASAVRQGIFRNLSLATRP
jgi:hypothetical protein